MQAPRHSSFNSHAGGALHAKEEVGWGEGAHQERRSVGERGNGERLWVSAWCLREVYKKEWKDVS